MSNKTSLFVGDPVEVNDPGLAMIAKFAPEGSPPNNHGYVHEIWEDGTILVNFPIGDDDMDEHSQVAPYPGYMVSPRGETDE